jgi:His/Glu/Gln/Arg/opine family amino acid ABC transporter permease subunit
VAFLNLRQLMVGLTFPQSEIWRINIAVYILIFLLLLIVGYWGSLNRWVLGVLAAIGLASLILPPLTRNVTPPDIYYYGNATKLDQVNFIGTEGEEITFSLDPLTTKADFDVEKFPGGYIGNDLDLGNASWIVFTNAARDSNAGTFDPASYNLRLAVQIWDQEGEVLATSGFTESPDEIVTLSFTPPQSGWYTFTMVRDEAAPGDAGGAWLRVQDLDVFYSTPYYQERREDRYGEPPELDCRGCNTKVDRIALRFEGERTVSQWLGLQLSPFLEMTRAFYFFCLLAGALGYGLGKVLAGSSLPSQISVRLMVFLWIWAILAWYLLIKGFGAAEPFPSIRTRDIGGLLLTSIFTVIPLVASFPLGILLALGRRSDLPAVSWVSTAFIEVFRGVPLITLLFLGFYIVQYFADFMRDLDVSIRLMIVVTFFTAAYLAEVIRGGLQIVPKGQLEAAYAVGLNGFWTNILIVLPQALRAVIPAILGQFLSLFKDTSLLALVSLFEITGAMRRVLGNPFYTAFGREGWIFVFIIYFLLSYAMAEASRKIEETGSGAVRRKQI